MPLSLRRGTVTDVLERHEGLVRAEVDGEPCVAYPALTGAVARGDEVVVNTQARALGLGSGGFDVLYLNLTRGLELAAEPDAHVVKLPYAPGQLALPHWEETGGVQVSLEGMPVVCCSLHSQLAPVCAALAGRRVAYVQLEGGALPLALSDAVRELRARGLVAATASVGACFGGNAECVTPWSALAWAKAAGHDAAVCAIGPGIVGTGSRLGHGGLAAATAANAALGLGGRPVVAARVSEADERDRHRGLSHHTQAVLDLVLGEVVVAAEAEGEGWRDACAGLPLSHMGRGPDEDPSFFRAAYAAGVAARKLLA
ncbi:MAG TPA: DUF3866 family protein [Gaiellaceae bacterium]|nr:DUF3866 family protein [Gaiellaceae bacterium]